MEDFAVGRILHNAFFWNRLTLIAAPLTALFLIVPVCLSAGENSRFSLDNGIDAVIHSPDDVMKMISRNSDGWLILSLPNGRSYRLIESIDNPQIMNKGDGSFHPVGAELVVKALSSIDLGGRRMKLSVNVYILPFPRDGFLASSAYGDDVILSPGVYEASSRTCAYSVSHEIGHVFQQTHLPSETGEDWTEYLKLRGLYGDPLFDETACHANRPAEIFAEDFRYLFGGEEARSSGTIENASLPLPDDVPGLKEYIASFASSETIVAADEPGASRISVSNYPNPFNPVTTIRALFRDGGGGPGAETDVALYRVDGSLVRNLFHGMMSGDELAVRWDGTDESGRVVSSGVYLYVVRRGDMRATGKMLLVK